MRRIGDLLGSRRKDRAFRQRPTSDWQLAPTPSTSVGLARKESPWDASAATGPEPAGSDKRARKAHRRFHFISEGIR